VAKRKKKRTKRQRQQLRGVSQTGSPVPTPLRSSEIDRTASDRLRIEAQEKRRRKKVRREVSNRFHEIRTQGSEPNLEEIVAFLSDYFPEIDLVREALQPYKYSQDPWCIEAWRILGSEDPEATAKRLLAQQQEVIDVQKRLILQHVPDPLIVQVATTEEGPAFEKVTPDFLRGLILQYVRSAEESVGFEFELDTGGVSFLQPGEYPLRLIFLNGDALSIRVRLELELDEVPGDCESAWEQVDSIDITTDSDVLAHLQEYLAAVPADDLWAWYRGATRVLKTAHRLGYWRVPWIQELLKEWREKSQRALLEASSRGDFGAIGVQGTVGTQALAEPVAEGGETEKLRILNLPPLVAYDLRTARVDLNVLQHLFRAPHLRHLRGKSLEEFTEDDIRRMSYGINQEVTNLKRGKYGRSVGIRALGMILLSVSRLQFDKLEIGTCESDIRFCLSGYSTRMGEYLIEQHNRYDSARDYYLEAITLNLVSGRGVHFPTTMLFRSSFKGAYIRTARDPVPYLKLLAEPKWRTQEVLEILTRNFMELGARHSRWAERWFEECPDDARQSMVNAVRNQLKLGEASFSDCVAAYKQAFRHLEALLNYMQLCSSSQGILYLAPELASRLQQLGFLLSSTNREIAQLLIEAGDAVRGFVQSKSYEDQRNYVNTATNLLERVLAYGADNRTALWAAYFSQIAERWLDVLQQEFSTIAQDIAPIIEVSLAERAISLGEDGQARVIFRVENLGAGTANPVNIRFQPTDPEWQVSLPHLRNFRLEPHEAVESYFNLEAYPDGQPLSFDFELSYYDPDRQLREQRSEEPLLVQPLQENKQLQKLKNPFRTDKEVDDERMFVGRDQLLDEVCEYAIKEAHGGLLMLYGQKRVGKSSLLLFMERRIDKVAHENRVMAVRVSWLDFSAHTAAGVIEELILGVQRKCRQLFGINLPVPSRDEIRTSYSLAFNDVLRDLELHGVSRLVLLVDEFDVIVHQLDRQLGFDRMFFEYLRGISKRGSVALVLTGGEMMPLLFDRLGEVFNHDRTWRIAYLSPTDGSVERLVENDYVRGYLHFSADAIATIKEVSACNPCFVQMICQEIVERSRRQQSAQVCKLDVQEVADWLVRQAATTKYVRHLYCPLQKPDPLDLAIIGITAEEEVLGHRPHFVAQQRIVQRIQGKYSDRVVTKIGELTRREILKRNPENSEEIRIMLPLFRDWFNDNKPEYSLWAPLLRR